MDSEDPQIRCTLLHHNNRTIHIHNNQRIIRITRVLHEKELATMHLIGRGLDQPCRLTEGRLCRTNMGLHLWTLGLLYNRYRRIRDKHQFLRNSCPRQARYGDDMRSKVLRLRPSRGRNALGDQVRFFDPQS